MENEMKPLFEYVDCIRLSVPDIEKGLQFYRDRLGHKVLWRMGNFVGLQMPGTQTEILLHTEPRAPEIYMRVPSVTVAVARITSAGGRVIIPPHEIEVGLRAMVADPFGNEYTIMDTSKGLLVTDKAGNVTGTAKQD
jgi:predicted enzyme related to lactoylglutathione lyase